MAKFIPTGRPRSIMSSFSPITAWQRGLDLLMVVNKLKSVSIKTIHEETGLHKATITRMLAYVDRPGLSPHSRSHIHTTFLARKLAIALGLSSSHSLSTASVCSPNVGGGRRYSMGVSDMRIGLATSGMRPASG
jgi:hypothetical protein